MSNSAFASLRPANVLAKLAFSDLYDSLKAGRQDSQADSFHAFRRMAVEPQQTFDSDVLRLRLETERRVSRKEQASDAETSESLPELDSDTESHQELGMIWAGDYLLGLENPPSVPERGYTLGKGPVEGVPIDLLLCMKPFTKRYSISLRNPHARLSFSTGTRALYITGCSRSASAQLTVNGEAATRRLYHLNQHSMKVRLDKLEYDFQWTDFAATEDFKRERSRYVTHALGGPLAVDIDMPTPLPNKRTMGGWTLGDALGAGGNGRVFFASNALGDVSAIKMLERTSKNNRIVDAKVQVSKDVTAFAERSDDGEHILRVAEVIYSNGKEFSSQAPFDNVGVVLKPMTPQTLADLFGIRSKGGHKGMKMEAAIAFRDALEAVKVMHDGRWVHRDLKPNNIGLVGEPLRSVLLDTDTAAYISPGHMLRPEPGHLGTVDFLAPEFELRDYDHAVDIWAMGVILYHLTYGHHPWKYALNPWRDLRQCEEAPVAGGRVHTSWVFPIRSFRDDAVGGLFVDMVRYRWASNNCKPRPDIDEVLRHPAWGLLLPDSPQFKRRRGFELDDGEV